MTTPNITARQRQLLNNAPLLMLLLLIVDSLHFVFARLLLPYLSPFTSSFYVLAVATVELAVFMAHRRQINWEILKKHLWFFLSVGFLVAVATVSSFAAVAYIDPGTASLVARTYTIFTLALGILWLKERLWPMA
ncbi:MAG: EamA family transporter, partial [Anaerolineae bacterium]